MSNVCEDPPLHDLLTKVMGGEHLSKDEAIRVWHEMHELGKTIPEGDVLICLYDKLARELSKGKRCGVCGRYGSEDCWTDC
jgi:hypothetical protein